MDTIEEAISKRDCIKKELIDLLLQQNEIHKYYTTDRLQELNELNAKIYILRRKYSKAKWQVIKLRKIANGEL